MKAICSIELCWAFFAHLQFQMLNWIKNFWHVIHSSSMNTSFPEKKNKSKNPKSKQGIWFQLSASGFSNFFAKSIMHEAADGVCGFRTSNNLILIHCRNGRGYEGKPHDLRDYIYIFRHCLFSLLSDSEFHKF